MADLGQHGALDEADIAGAEDGDVHAKNLSRGAASRPRAPGTRARFIRGSPRSARTAGAGPVPEGAMIARGVHPYWGYGMRDRSSRRTAGGFSDSDP